LYAQNTVSSLFPTPVVAAEHVSSDLFHPTAPDPIPVYVGDPGSLPGDLVLPVSFNLLIHAI